MGVKLWLAMGGGGKIMADCGWLHDLVMSQNNCNFREQNKELKAGRK